MEQDDSRNPPEAVEALFPQSIDCGEGVAVRPFSLAIYAMLEKIGSYIILPHDPDQAEVLESLYVCTHDPRPTMKLLQEGGRPALLDAAVAWASGVPPYLLSTITDAVRTQIQRVRAVVPPPREGDKKKDPTGG